MNQAYVSRSLTSSNLSALGYSHWVKEEARQDVSVQIRNYGGQLIVEDKIFIFLSVRPINTRTIISVHRLKGHGNRYDKTPS